MSDASNSTTLYHMCDSSTWEQCLQDNAYFPPTYEADGFIHLTADPLLLLTVANHFYKDVVGDWVVLCIDSSKLNGEVKYEPAAPVGDKQTKNFNEGEALADEPLFPHLYGPITPDAVFKQLAMHRSEDGTFLGIEGL